MDSLVYEDNPWHCSWTKVCAKGLFYFASLYSLAAIIFFVVLAIFFVELTQTLEEILIPTTTLVIVLIMLARMPTKYQIFNDRIRIVRGWICRFDIPFNNIENAAPGKWNYLWGLYPMPLLTFSSDEILQITRKRGVNIYLTPENRPLFLENLNKAMTEWRKYNISY